MTVLLVRHAKAGDRATWAGADAERPLTAAGDAQAEALVDLLDPFAIDRVLSSPAIRCVETVEPLAGHRGLIVEATDDLAEGSGAEGTLRLARDAEDATVVLCTHGDVIFDLLTELRGRGLEVRVSGGKIRAAKGSTWVLKGSGEHFRSADYLPAP